jgi:hypothetical protein
MKELVLKSLIKEVKIIKRLSSKLSPEMWDYRPKEGIRSNLELVRYLSGIGCTLLDFWMNADGQDWKTFTSTNYGFLQTLTPDQIQAALDKQIVKLEHIFSQFSDADLMNKQVTYPWNNNTCTLMEAILEGPLKWLTAYKMQLFVNLKINSEEKLGTPDAWYKTEIDNEIPVN